MRAAATPREAEELREQLDLLDYIDDERKTAITRMVFEVVVECPICEEPVRRCDSRRLVDERLMHLSCAGDAGTARGRDGGREVIG
jgi:hypothetical protein